MAAKIAALQPRECVHKSRWRSESLETIMPARRKLEWVDNATLAELLAAEADRQSGVRQKAFRKAARAAWLWPEEAAQILQSGRSLVELPNVGPFLEKQIRAWIEHPPNEAPDPPPIRRDFLTLTKARALLAAKPAWLAMLRGDLQMHTRWSDGSGSIAEMADAAAQRGYYYIAITDHSKGLKIAGGINEEQLAAQRTEIEATNASLQLADKPLVVLHSLEMNLSPDGRGDMESAALGKLDLVLG